jgi:hypothetical protein
MVVHLETIRGELEAVNSQAAALCEGLSDHDLAWRSGPGKWSIAENLVHLRVTTETFLPWVDSAITATLQGGIVAPGPFRLGIYGRILVWYVEPPPVIRLPAPRALTPLLTGSAAQVLSGFLESQQHMMGRIEAAKDLDLTRLRFASPLAAYVRMNLLEFLSVFNGHSRRHLWQAANVRHRISQRKQTSR